MLRIEPTQEHRFRRQARVRTDPHCTLAADEEQKHTLGALLFDGTSCGEMLAPSQKRRDARVEPARAGTRVSSAAARGSLGDTLASKLERRARTIWQRTYRQVATCLYSRA
jgi:hypothetical protein